MNPKTARENFSPYNEVTLKRLVIAATTMYFWLIIWALVLKLGNEAILVGNYTNLKALTLRERIMWDIVPFNYRGEGLYKVKIIMDTALNCLVFAPFGVAFGYLFKKTNILRDAALCLGLSLLIELTQLATMLGNPATEDLITNVAGYFIGFALYKLVFARLSVKNSVRVMACVCIIFAAATVFSIAATADSAEVICKIITRTL
jgi:glycopeptide antibiotics resistance protein